jgi:omega-amidase
MPTPLRTACLGLSSRGDPRANAQAIRTGLAAAAAAGARVLLTPECCLTGYPGAARSDFADLAGCMVADLEDHLAAEAAHRGMLLILGSASTDGHHWSNDAVCCGAVSAVRYRKRALTPADQQHFQAGTQPTTINFAGWKLGISICYEVRFPSLWTDADAFLCIAHMAGADPDPGTKAGVIPGLYAARATEWAAPLALANTADADRWLDSGVWDARGMLVAAQAEGLVVSDLVHRDQLDPWYRTLNAHQRMIQGV